MLYIQIKLAGRLSQQQLLFHQMNLLKPTDSALFPAFPKWIATFIRHITRVKQWKNGTYSRQRSQIHRFKSQANDVILQRDSRETVLRYSVRGQFVAAAH